MNIIRRHLSRGTPPGRIHLSRAMASWSGRVKADGEIWLKGPGTISGGDEPVESLPPRRTAAKCVLAAWMIVAVCAVTACDQAGSIKGAVGSAVSSVAASVTHPASLPAAPTHPASTAAETTTAASPDATTTPAEAASPTSAPATETTAAGGGGGTTPTAAPTRTR